MEEEEHEMKVAIIADTHFGVRGDDPALRDKQMKFFNDHFWPHVKKNDIKSVVHLGDLFDRRKYVNYRTAQACHSCLVSPIIETGIDAHFVVGNHDSYFRNTNAVNSISTLYETFPMKIYKNSETVNIGDRRVLMIPWICDENSAETERNVRETDALIALGHLELTGFEMYRGQVCDHGYDPANLSKFDVVLSGHFHTRSRVGNITYVGSTGQYTWADEGDSRGFSVLDTDTGEVEFFPNPVTSFEKIVIHDMETARGVIESIDVTDRYVKVIFKCKTDPFALEKLIDTFDDRSVIDLQVIEDGYSDETRDDLTIETTDTLAVLMQMTDNLDDVDTEAAKKLVRELYAEAHSK